MLDICVTKRFCLSVYSAWLIIWQLAYTEKGSAAARVSWLPEWDHWVANIGERLAGRRKQNLKYQCCMENTVTPYFFIFSHSNQMASMNMLPCSKFFCVSYFSTTLTVVSAEFFPVLIFFYENAYVNHTWNEFLNYFVLF